MPESAFSLRTVVVEKAPTFGGSAARSGAGTWIPCGEVILAAGVPDTPRKAAACLSAVVGNTVPAARRQAFPAVSFVMRHSSLRFRWMEGCDYYPELPGGCRAWRAGPRPHWPARSRLPWARRRPPGCAPDCSPPVSRCGRRRHCPT
ncbi:MAG TPA: hypothetical protein VJT49_11290 [Amycolatopsis sp.]|uniref:hypothetical protein n=1 Tax=Amycolatopsis sp. TaxID=37632 RepID=UPI002B460FA4|nr:hypothetical protein [Amycolatopsis sp.]HKS45674.1 hypothetical protein [Amycolatopsis sp.]